MDQMYIVYGIYGFVHDITRTSKTTPYERATDQVLAKMVLDMKVWRRIFLNVGGSIDFDDFIEGGEWIQPPQDRFLMGVTERLKKSLQEIVAYLSEKHYIPDDEWVVKHIHNVADRLEVFEVVPNGGVVTIGYDDEMGADMLIFGFKSDLIINTDNLSEVKLQELWQPILK